MPSKTPRIRMFAGPNGSGKSTLKNVIQPCLIGIYVNADDIEAAIKETGRFEIGQFGLIGQAGDLRQILTKSIRLKEYDLSAITENADVLHFVPQKINSYIAAVIAEFIRDQLILLKESFTFETVMSHESKVDLLKKAQAAGYRTYLYFVATEDPEINCSRVANRVQLGIGSSHNVPTDKIISRYQRSLNLLKAAIHNSDRAYIFDNSGEAHSWIAEITEGTTLEYKTTSVPRWFQKYVLTKKDTPPKTI